MSKTKQSRFFLCIFSKKGFAWTQIKMLRSNRKAETKVIEKWYFAFNYQLNEKIQQKVKNTFFPVCT